MKIAVMGAGAVGCFFGALLQQAGHDVVLIGRQALADAVNQRGLHLEMKGFDGLVPMRADASPSAVAGAELVLFCVKSYDTESAGAQIKPHLAANAAVISLQNGIDNAPRLSQVLGRDAIAGVVYVAAEMAGAGHVRHHGRGELVIGEGARSAEMAALLGAAKIPTEVSPRVIDALWAKLFTNCVYNPLSAVTQLRYGTIANGVGMQPVMRDIYDEAHAVALASGINVAPAQWDDLLSLSVSMAGQRSSTAQDVARGKHSEIDYINGHVVREGERLGIATPANRMLLGLVKLLDGSGRRDG